jgi:hypothetical protein
MKKGGIKMLPIITRLSGVTFKDAQKNINKYGGPGVCAYDLVREPDNPHDPHAIKVLLFDAIFLGYVPKHIAMVLAPLMDEGRNFEAEFYQLNKSALHKTVGLTVRIFEVNHQHEQEVH